MGPKIPPSSRSHPSFFHGMLTQPRPLSPLGQRGQQVRCLVGGIINYYNQGGRVREPGPPSPAVGVDGEGVLLPLASGREVQAVHPGHPLDVMRAFVTRPNNYKGGGFEH